ncbi:uncharacterized protein [Halyomorpha halys]|uniref:uncharacterized protein isoform X2 n=1 Tax=Halyomorpha halys TaxID=286706 RepID=UPI0006D528ED|nr:uncharacterized protein LOC106687712 isoform X1 [Halyomorpha halys]
MNIFFFILAVFPYFKLILSNTNISDTLEAVTKEDHLWTVKRVVIPLLDVGVLWAEDKLIRTKRNPNKLSKNSAGFMNSIIQQTKNGNQTDSSDTFVDSLVSLMSKSDPALLLKLQKRIEEFEQTRSNKVYRNFRPEKQRPLIQFFNVTKISVSSEDDDDKTKNAEGSVSSKNEDQIVKTATPTPHQKESQSTITSESSSMAVSHSVSRLVEKSLNHDLDPEENESELSAKTDATTLLKTKDGKIAKIQRSRDKKRYRLEIDCSTIGPSEDVNENEDLEAERKKRKAKALDHPSGTERYMGYLQGVVGCSSGYSFIKHSFPLH